MKIEVKDNNIEQALRVLKRKLQRDGFFKVVKLKSVYEKPSLCNFLLRTLSACSILLSLTSIFINIF